MKKILTLVMFISLAVSLSSCNPCLFFVFFNLRDDDGHDCLRAFFDISFITSVDNALHDAPNAPPPGGTQEVRTPLPPGQIEGEPISSEPGGGNQQEEDQGSTFNDIITSPTFTLGPSLSWLGGDKEDSEKFPARPGFQLGAVWQVPLTDRLTFEPGMLYANRGLGYESEESGYYEPGVPGGSYNYSYGQKKKLHYLELPLCVSGSVLNGLDLYGGPQIAFLLGAKIVNESNGETTSTEKGTAGLKKVDVGLTAGARYHVPNTFFSVSLGYYHGFSNLSSGSEYGGYGYDEPKYFTRAARLGVQYNFPAARSHAKSQTGTKSSFKSWISK